MAILCSSNLLETKLKAYGETEIPIHQSLNTIVQLYIVCYSEILYQSVVTKITKRGSRLETTNSRNMSW